MQAKCFMKGALALFFIVLFRAIWMEEIRCILPARSSNNIFVFQSKTIFFISISRINNITPAISASIATASSITTVVPVGCINVMQSIYW